VFLKRCRRRKCGKGHVYWQLVESHRTPRGSRHRVVAYLGELSKSERRGWSRLAATLDGKAATKIRQLSLFEPPCDDDDPVPETVQVKTKGVRVEGTRDFGDVYLGLCLWRMLGLDELFERELPEGREDIPWHLAACILAIARLVEPSSELHIEDTWCLKTALADLVGLRLTYRSVKKWRDWAALSEGCYLLRTNLSGETPEDLWKTYIQLTDVEEVFRTEKTELAIRPIWHQLEHRVQAHVLFSFLAYAMWKTLQTWMERAGVGRGARTVIEEFALPGPPAPGS